jgi:hypothetical protein
MDFSPSADELPANVSVMYDDLVDWNLTDEDAGRVEQALNIIGRTCNRFPTPWTVREALPKKEQKIAGYLEKKETPEEKAARMARGKAALANIRKGLKNSNLLKYSK